MTAKKKVGRTLAGLREAMFETLDDLRSEAIKSDAACASAKIASTILNAARLQLDFEKAWKSKQIEETLRKIPLVTEAS